MKKNRHFIISSILILLPMVFGIVMYDQLPDIITSHYNMRGTADGFSPKTFLVFGLPLLLLVIHLVSIWFTLRDNKHRAQSKKMMTFVYYIIPILSLLLNGFMYAVSLGYALRIEMLVYLLIAFMFIGLGNYLPKTVQNHTIGVKVPWTLQSEDNWYHTHRFTGHLWVLSGVVLLITMLLPESIGYRVFIVILVACGFLPIIYSYVYYRKEVRNDVTMKSIDQKPISKTYKFVTIGILVITIVGVVIVLFTGKIQYTIGEDAFTMDATYYEEVEIPYADITSITYLEEDTPGTRTFGWGSYRLLLGSFRNDAEGDYSRYTYYGDNPVIRIATDDLVYIINDESVESTEALYAQLSAKVNP